MEARVYLDRNDHEDNFISNALAQKYMSADGQFGNKFVELAETAAVGRALSDAGFGLQFADREGDMDPEVTEAPFDPQMIAGAGGALPEGTYMDSALQEGAAGDGEVLQEEAFPGQYGIEEYIPMPEEVGQAMGMPPAMHQAGAAPAASRQAAQGTVPTAARQAAQGTAPTAAGQAAQGIAPAAARQATQGTAPAAAQTQQHAQAQQPVQGMPPAMQNRQAAPNPAQGGRAAVNAGRQAAQKAGNAAAGNTAAAKGANAQAAGSIRKDMPVEQIYSMLNRDSAAAVVIPMGFNKGKTLGQVAMEKPANLQWYVDSYGGPDNLLRAAAKFLIDAALGQAS